MKHTVYSIQHDLFGFKSKHSGKQRHKKLTQSQYKEGARYFIFLPFGSINIKVFSVGRIGRINFILDG